MPLGCASDQSRWVLRFRRDCLAGGVILPPPASFPSRVLMMSDLLTSPKLQRDLQPQPSTSRPPNSRRLRKLARDGSMSLAAAPVETGKQRCFRDIECLS